MLTLGPVPTLGSTPCTHIRLTHCPCTPVPHLLPPGKVLAALDRKRLTNQTLVYFTSDNGGRLEAGEGGVRAGGWNGVYRGE